MTQYLISFEDGAMDFPEEDLPAVAETAHAVAKDAGVFVVDVPTWANPTRKPTDQGPDAITRTQQSR